MRALNSCRRAHPQTRFMLVALQPLRNLKAPWPQEAIRSMTGRPSVPASS